jgi:hypothetical protein
MAQREPSAAQALYGHLPSAAREPVKQRQPTLGDALWPQLSREAKQREAWQEEYRKRDREALLKALRMVNGRGRG